MLFLLSIIFILIIIVLYIYMKKYTPSFSLISKLFISAAVLLFSAAIVVFPEESFNAALDGLKLWLNAVCPSLLPFFIGSRLLVDLGVVNFIGVLLEPVMRPVFRVPGCGSFPFLMSITSGYPVGSKIVAELYQKKMCSKTEAQRMLSFCSTSGPLFMIGAVGIGMLSTNISGTVISLSHYLGAVTVGLMFRFYRRKGESIINYNPSGLKNAVNTYKKTIMDEKRPLGLILSDGVKDSVAAVLNIGGFIILFSVIIKLMDQLGIISILSNIISAILYPLGLSRQLSGPVTSGLFEITVGSKLISSLQIPIGQRIAAISGIIAWSGFSIIAQVASMISSTDLKLSTYIASKILHAVSSGAYAFILLCIIDIPVLSRPIEVLSPSNSIGWMDVFSQSITRFLWAMLFMIALTFISRMASSLYSKINR